MGHRMGRLSYRRTGHLLLVGMAFPDFLPVTASFAQQVTLCVVWFALDFYLST